MYWATLAGPKGGKTTVDSQDEKNRRDRRSCVFQASLPCYTMPRSKWHVPAFRQIIASSQVDLQWWNGSLIIWNGTEPFPAWATPQSSFIYVVVFLPFSGGFSLKWPSSFCPPQIKELGVWIAGSSAAARGRKWNWRGRTRKGSFHWSAAFASEFQLNFDWDVIRLS